MTLTDVKGDFDLGHAPGRGRDPDQLELPEHLVVGGHLTLALVDLDLHLGLAVGGSGEHLRLLGGDGGVARDKLGEHASQSLDAERQRGHVQQQDISDVTCLIRNRFGKSNFCFNSNFTS